MMDTSIEVAIQKIESLYTSLTGQAPPACDKSYAPFPPEADPLAHVEAQFDRLARLITNLELVQPTWSPPICVWEDQNEFAIQVELAGVPQSEIDVSTVGQLVTISGTRGPIADDRSVWLNDQDIGPFRRTIRLPPHVDEESMRLSTTLGMLQLRFAHLGSVAGAPKGKRTN